MLQYACCLVAKENGKRAECARIIMRRQLIPHISYLDPALDAMLDRVAHDTDILRPLTMRVMRGSGGGGGGGLLLWCISDVREGSDVVVHERVEMLNLQSGHRSYRGS